MFPLSHTRLGYAVLSAAPLTLTLVALTGGGVRPALAAAIGFAAPVSLQGACGGEPSIDNDGKGHVYVSSPKGILAGLASCEGALTSTQGVATWSSSDGGRTFGPKVSAGLINGGGDSDTTVDQKTGDVYVADLAAIDADVCVSHDHGLTYVTAVTGAESCSTTPINITGQTGPDDDREWITVYGPTAAYPHKDVYLSYHDFTIGLPMFFVSRDGAPFTPAVPTPGITDPAFVTAVGSGTGTVVAKPVIDADGTIHELVTVQAAGNGPLQQLWLVSSADHGATFTDQLIFDGTSTGAQIGLVFNDLAEDGAGNLYALTLGNTQGTAPPDNAYLFSSTDRGHTWSSPHPISTDNKAVALAALHGGPLAGQVVLGYYHSTNTTDTNDVAGLWNYHVLESTNANSASPTFVSAVAGSASNPSTGIVHQGQICTAGINCTASTGAGQGNRNLADFSSVTVDQNGCPIFTYADDGTIKSDQSNFAFNLVNNDVTRQTTGCFATSVAGTATATPTANPVVGANTSPNTAALSPVGALAAAAGALLIASGAALAVRRRKPRRRPGQPG